MRKRTLIAVAVGLACTLVPIARVGAKDKTIFIELELRSGGLPSAVNATGTVVVGGLANGGGMYWMPTIGVIFNGGVFSSDVSRDGRTIVGSVLDAGVQQAGIWQRAAEWQPLGSFPNAAPCGSSLSSGLGTSADGKVVVGSANNGCTGHAFRWEAGTMVDLGSSVAGRASVATGVSGDGKVVVGFQDRSTGERQGARWLDGRQELIPVPPGQTAGFVGPANAANFDGSIIVGENCVPSSGAVPLDQSAWVWTAARGTECLPPPALRVIPGPNPLVIGEANGLSDDGRIIGGSQRAGSAGDAEAIVWIDRKPVYLKDLLRANGYPDAFATWVKTGQVEDVSPDGRILVGSGAAAAGFRGYIVILGSDLVVP